MVDNQLMLIPTIKVISNPTVRHPLWAVNQTVELIVEIATRFKPINPQILMEFGNIKTTFKDMILKILYLTSKAKEA
jgi:hypothetical protein